MTDGFLSLFQAVTEHMGLSPMWPELIRYQLLHAHLGPLDVDFADPYRMRQMAEYLISATEHE